MIQFGENVLCVVDVETNGRDAAFHEILQVAVLPLEPYTLEPAPKYRPFYQNIKPDHPERSQPEAMAVNGLSLEELSMCPDKRTVADEFYNWFKGMGLPMGKRLIPLAQNTPFDVPFMQQWLGLDLYYEIFTRRCRDTMHTALGINDAHAFKGFALPFPEVGLKSLCNHFAIDLSDHHDALADCIATAKIYKHLLQMEQI